MDCNEFSFPILSVFLLQNGNDIIYNIPSNAEGQDLITLSTSSATGYARIVPDSNGVYGTPLIADPSTFSLESQLTAKQGGQYQKVTLEYKTTALTYEERISFLSQQSLLRQNFYSLLIESFDGTYGLIRAFTHGDGYLFTSKSSDSETTNTITITNLTGLQRITSIN